MSRAAGRSLILLATVALAAAGCQNRETAQAGKADGICTPFASTAAATPGQTAVAPAPGAGDAMAPLDDCLHRWAYSLAPSSDPANVVGAATVAACNAALARWNQATLGDGQDPSSGAEPLSLTTGEPTNAFAEHYGFAQSRALFYVVQARAGKCAPPPAAETRSSANG